LELQRLCGARRPRGGLRGSMFFSGKDEIDEREPIFFSGDDAELVCLPPNGLVSGTGNASTFFSGTPPAYFTVMT
ncbi:unnamed protein product, partial [Urochloa humidicola]